MLGSKKGWNTKFNGRTQFIFNWIKFSGKNIIQGNLLRQRTSKRLELIFTKKMFLFKTERETGDDEHQTRK